MWSYYELTTAQTQADRRASAGFSISPAAAHEFPTGAIARALIRQRQAETVEKREARCSKFLALIHAFKVLPPDPALVR